MLLKVDGRSFTCLGTGESHLGQDGKQEVVACSNFTEFELINYK